MIYDLFSENANHYFPIAVAINSLIPVILCGGSGKRLWPLSRATYPKQYWALYGENNETLLQQTIKRLSGLKGLEEPLLICHEDHRFIVAEQMRQINIDPAAILLEPIGRNTAPAVCLAALKATESGEDPLILILPADHVMQNANEFRDVIEIGRKKAEEGKLVTFGIIPERAETGYGYIQAKEILKSKPIEGSEIEKFIEKPNQESAEKYIIDQRFTWNSGIFLFKASAILSEIERLSPEIMSCCRASLDEEVPDLDFIRLERESFIKCPNISIDIAVMEKTSLGEVFPLNAGWSDIGNWNALWEIAKKDENQNVIRGNVILEKSKDCYIRSEQRLIVGLGIKNLVIVETDDAVLVAEKDQSQEIKNIVQKLESQGLKEGVAHRKIYRPWGNYTEIVHGNRWQVKRIEVKPGASLSLQMHHHRAEHWIVVKGTALVEQDTKKQLLGENQSTFIPLGCKHRLSNPGRMPMELIEVQSGTYLGEDDIVRFQDEYGRIAEKIQESSTQL